MDADEPSDPWRCSRRGGRENPSLDFLEREDIGQTLTTGFYKEHNPIIRHTVLRRRVTLEEAGLLERVAVDVHPDPLASNNAYAGVGFQGLGLLTNHPFNLAYEAAEKFTDSLKQRTRAAGFMKTLLLQRICSSFASGNRAAVLANERAVPLSKSSLERGVIVAPHKEHQQNEDEGGNQSEERQGSRRHGRRICCDGIDVKDQPTDTDNQQNRPSSDLEIRPFDRWGQLLGKGRLMRPMRGRSAHNQVGSAASSHDSTQPRPAFTSEESFFVSERNFFEIGAIALRAAQVHLFTPCSPTSVWLESFLTNPSCYPHPTRQYGFSCLRLAHFLVEPFSGPCAEEASDPLPQF